MIDEQRLRTLIKDCIREVLDERQMIVDADVLTKDQVARVLGVTIRSVTTYMRREGMPHEIRGGRPVFRREKVLGWWRDRGRPVPALRAI